MKKVNFRKDIVTNLLDNDNYSRDFKRSAFRDSEESLLLDGFNADNTEHFDLFVPIGFTDQPTNYDPEPTADHCPEKPYIPFDFSYMLEDGKTYKTPRLIVTVKFDHYADGSKPDYAIGENFTWCPTGKLRYLVFGRQGDWLLCSNNETEIEGYKRHNLILHIPSGRVKVCGFRFRQTQRIAKALRNITADNAVKFVKSL